MVNLTDEQRVAIADKEYENLKINQEIIIDGITIGYVSEVIDNKKTGEQAFIITDGNPSSQKPGEVNHVTVLYQGSLGLDKTLQNPGEVKRDWWDNNKKIAENVISSYDNPKSSYEPTNLSII